MNFFVISENRKEIEERKTLNNQIEELPYKFNQLIDLVNNRYFGGQEDFHINVSDYKDIRLLEKVRKKAPKQFKAGDHGNCSADDEGTRANSRMSAKANGDESDTSSSSDEELYANMTSDFNTLIPLQKTRHVPSKRY